MAGVVTAVLGITAFTMGVFSSREPVARQTTPEQFDTNVQMAIDSYNQAIAAIAAGNAPVGQALTKAKALEWALMYDRVEGAPSALERMSEGQRAQLTRRVPGLQIWSSESQGVEIDPAFFLDLAQRYGSDGDREFFISYRRMFPEGYGWPVYLEQQTDVTGCTKYGSGDLAVTYTMWSGYRARYPGMYDSEVREYLTEVTQALVDDTCACGDAQSVIRELSQFARAFPRDAITPRVRQRLKAVIAGKSKTRFHCMSG
jgi:hypothetical protein